MAQPSVSILILNWNGKGILRECLSSIYAGTEYEAFSVLVIDNDSDDGSVAMVREEFPEADVLENAENLSFAAANNRAIRRVDSDYVMLLNNDVEVSEGWLAPLVEVAESAPERAVVSPRIVYPDGTPQFLGDKVLLDESNVPELIVETVRWIERQFDEEKQIFSCIGAAMLVDTDLFDDIGYLDEEFEFYKEETDFCIRAKTSGYELWYTPASEIVHKSRSSSATNPYYEYYLRRKSRLRYYVLNYSAPRILFQLPFELLTVVDSVLRHYSKWLFKAYWDGLKRLPADLKERRSRSQVHYTSNKIDRAYRAVRKRFP